ncbi:unnamed protein product [Onchocerca flexuosa]|uniref:Doublecortin domain-containing protein n=1 Tax=Onchocerca flexuosa TaxID=387005 RepID=A0A183HKD5_9BILA|nr:unnamed protein product [Onchocerca flexuosa]
MENEKFFQRLMNGKVIDSSNLVKTDPGDSNRLKENDAAMEKIRFS